MLRVHTFLRLLGFLKPYKRGAIVSLVLAATAMGATVAIPWLTGLAVDEIDSGDESGLLPDVFPLMPPTGRVVGVRIRGEGRHHRGESNHHGNGASGASTTTSHKRAGPTARERKRGTTPHPAFGPRQPSGHRRSSPSLASCPDAVHVCSYRT